MFGIFIFRFGVWGLLFFAFFDFLLAQEIKIDATHQKIFADLIENVAEQVLGGDQPVPVKNLQGKIVGVLHQKKVLNVLFGKRK